MSSQNDTGDGAPDLSAVNGNTDGKQSVQHAAQLVAFTEAVMKGEATDIERERDALFSLTSKATVVDAAAVRAQLGYLSANTGIYERLTPRELLRYFGRLHGLLTIAGPVPGAR